MAIFGNHIKGTGNANSADSASTTSGLWTGLEGSKAELKNLNTVRYRPEIDLTPRLKVRSYNGSIPEDNASYGGETPEAIQKTGIDLGHILTDHAFNTRIYQDWTFEQYIVAGVDRGIYFFDGGATTPKKNFESKVYGDKTEEGCPQGITKDTSDTKGFKTGTGNKEVYISHTETECRNSKEGDPGYPYRDRGNTEYRNSRILFVNDQKTGIGLPAQTNDEGTPGLAIDSYDAIAIRFYPSIDFKIPSSLRQGDAPYNPDCGLMTAAVGDYIDPAEPGIGSKEGYLQYESGARTTLYEGLHVQGHIKCDEYVQALYFNATSDKRAKDNIHPLLTNALDIIKNVNVYTFNFKSKPEERMIGVIAQEFLDKKLDGVSLVENEAATGENDDYMSIRESKLVYLLLKGMQEQQAQIEQLQRRISELESK